MKTAIYPGTFDPITYGHIDVIKKSLKIFDRVIVATTDNINKNYYFSIDERLSIIKNSLFKDLKLNKKKIKVIAFDTLTINLCKRFKASVIIRGLRAVSDVENKNYLFSSYERIEIVKKALFFDLKLNKTKILVISFTSLTTDLCKKYKSNIILRGLRAVSDFEYEFQLAGMNRKLNSNIETLFLMSDVENQIISSKFVKEIIKLKGNVKKFTTKSTIKSLKDIYA